MIMNATLAVIDSNCFRAFRLTQKKNVLSARNLNSGGLSVRVQPSCLKAQVFTRPIIAAIPTRNRLPPIAVLPHQAARRHRARNPVLRNPPQTNRPTNLLGEVRPLRRKKPRRKTRVDARGASQNYWLLMARHKDS